MTSLPRASALSGWVDALTRSRYFGVHLVGKVARAVRGVDGIEYAFARLYVARSDQEATQAPLRGLRQAELATLALARRSSQVHPQQGGSAPPSGEGQS